jgi:MinD superfamily P-loop ATPase
MPYSINKECIQCNDCVSRCPTGAIKTQDDGRYWIDPTLCNQCEGYYPEPQCLSICPVDSPMPLQAKKGRNKVNPRPLTSQNLFLNGSTNIFASALVVWELCNILTQKKIYSLGNR